LTHNQSVDKHMAEEFWGQRWISADSQIARKYMETAVKKKSLVCLAADRSTMKGLVDLVNEVGPYIAALKTHVDLVDDWTADGWKDFCELAHQSGLMIFEDRKFADIGKITRKQMGGIYDIKAWSDLVTAHLISGPDIVDGIQSAWSDAERVGGVLLLAQMSSRGNLLETDYAAKVVESGKANSGVFGFIGNGSNPDEIKRLRDAVGHSKMIWTPGINLETGDGAMGQRYGDPREAVLSGSDCIIVGSGIHGSENPAEKAKKYAELSFAALIERGG